jgi:DNA-binding FadR family transcriptional regulator
MDNDEKISASESLRLQLEELILNRHYLPGDRLPAERDIMRRMMVGRGTVREAYGCLQQKGLIEIRHGGGAFVREVDSAKVGDTLATLIRHRRISSRHLQEFRDAVESRCAAYAAERATPEQIRHLNRLIDEMENLLRSSRDENLQFYELELNLHTQLAKISGNPMFEWFAITFERNAAAFSGILADQSEKPEEALADWREFIQAVETREVTRAAMIIRSHILRFGKILENLDSNENVKEEQRK